MKIRYLDDAQRKWVRDWWRAIHPPESPAHTPPTLTGLGRQARARLRRCTAIQDLVLDAAALRLAGRLLELEGGKEHPRFADNYAVIAMAAGVLATVKSDVADNRSLAARLGGESPAMSELRFVRLMRTETESDFYRQLRRAVQLAGETADVAVLANDVIAWAIEGRALAFDPDQRMKSRWARDYYLPGRGQAHQQDTTSESLE